MNFLTIHFTEHFVYILVGIVAGVINTVAGSGSILTLGVMTIFGMDTSVANGTNRLGIVLFGVFGMYQFQKKQAVDYQSSWKSIITALLGGIIGTIAAIQISTKGLEQILGFVFLFFFFVVLFKPQDKLKISEKHKNWVPFWMFFVGLYAGFIQVGAGIIMLVLLKLLFAKSYQLLNPIKMLIITLVNIFSLILFTQNGMMDWAVGISLSVGQIIGAYYGVKLNSSSKNLEKPIRWLLLSLILVSIAKFWNFI